LTLKIKKTLKIIIPLLFGGGLVWYLFTIIPPKTLLEYFKNANYWWIALGLFFGILSHISRAYRWKFMLEPLGYNPRFINSTLAVLISYFVNLAIPRAGEVSRASVMTNYENIPFENRRVIMQMAWDEFHFHLKILNNGKPLPSNFIKADFVKRGYSSLSTSENSGIGGYTINRYATYLGSPNWTLINNPESEYPVGFSFSFPLSI